MDGLDADILRQMLNEGSFQWDFRRSYTETAAALGFDEETVRLRIKRMEAEGVLQGWDLIVNPALLGRAFLRVVTQVGDGVDKADAIARVGLIEGVLWVFENMGPTFGVVAFVEPGGASDRCVKLVEAITKGPTAGFPVSTASPDITMSPRDWRLLAALRQGPRDRLVDIAERSGLSEKTVRRRVQDFVDGRACFLTMRLDFAKARGVIPVEVKVWLNSARDRGPIDAYLQTLPHPTFSRYDGDVSQQSFLAETVGQVEEVRSGLAMLPGIARLRLEVLVRRPVFNAWLDEQIAARAGAAQGRIDAEPRVPAPAGRASKP